MWPVHTCEGPNLPHLPNLPRLPPAAPASRPPQVEYAVVTVFDDGYTNPLMKEQPWYFQRLWDISDCCSDQDEENRFLALMK